MVHNKNQKRKYGSRRDIPQRNVMMIEIGAGVVLIAVLILLYVWYTDGLTSYKPAGATYQYHAGTRIDYSGSASFYKEEQKGNGIRVEDNGKDFAVLNTPLISEDNKEHELSITCDMALYVPEESLRPAKVFTFTKVTNSGRKITYAKDKKTAQSFGGFLYDGGDLYIFLDNTRLLIGDEEYELEPLSYVRAVYNQQVEVYNSSGSEYDMTGVSGVDIMAYCGSDYYINLGADLLYCRDNVIILNDPIDNVAPIEMGK